MKSISFRFTETSYNFPFAHPNRHDPASGFSSKTDKPRMVENLNNELMTQIDSVTPDKPIVLVCHALGSPEAIYFVNRIRKRLRLLCFPVPVTLGFTESTRK